MLKDNLYIIVLSVYVLVLGLDIIKLIRLVRRPPLNFNLGKYLFRLHLIVLFCGITLSIVLVAFEVNIFNYTAPIEYKYYEGISLKDFNGFKLPGQTLQGENHFAFITSTIEYDIDENGVTVRSLFHPARSYVYINDLRDENLLRHELYHFHITEIWGRELRKEISNMGIIPSREDIDQLAKSILFNLNQMQNEYDYDTDHSYLLGNQIKWQNKIDSTLKTLTPFSNTYIRF